MKLIKKGGVGFAYHANPEPYNIGDVLCSPINYFDFECDYDEATLVVGGGAIGNGRTLFSEAGYVNRVVWAVGDSAPLIVTPQSPKAPAPLLQRAISKIRRRLTRISLIKNNTSTKKPTQHSERSIIYSTRDRESVGSGEHFLPCPSCFHPIASMPRGVGKAVILNKNLEVSGKIEEIFDSLSETNPELMLATNAMRVAELQDIFSRSDKIITNSYHIAYWSLLSGGSVKLIGYSNKSKSLLEIFDLDSDALQIYPKGEGRALLAHVRNAVETGDWLSLAQPEAVRAQFQELNLHFARMAEKVIPTLAIRLRSAPRQLET